MKFALVGVGGAGGRVVEHLRWLEANTERAFSNGNLLAFDTTKDTFTQYKHIPLDKHVLVGDTHPDIAGEGLDGDIDLGAAIAREDVDEIHREFDKLALHEVDAIVMVAGLGGGTGGGVGPVLLENLQSISDNPIFVVGVLPAESEDDQVAVNAARSLQSYVRLADNVILFDNDAWYCESESESEDESLEAAYDSLNDELATRIMAVLAAGELTSTDVAENRVDSSDLARTLETGGVSTIGFAQTTLREPSTLLDKLRAWLGKRPEDDVPTDALHIKTLIRDATTGRLTLPCEIDSADRGLIVLSGPPKAISRKGFESGRYWLEQETETVEVLAGDEPRPKARRMSAVVLLTNVTAVPRIDALKERAVAAKRKDEIVFSATADGSPNPQRVDTDETGDEPDETGDEPDEVSGEDVEPSERDSDGEPAPTDSSSSEEEATDTSEGDSPAPEAGTESPDD